MRCFNIYRIFLQIFVATAQEKFSQPIKKFQAIWTKNFTGVIFSMDKIRKAIYHAALNMTNWLQISESFASIFLLYQKNRGNNMKYLLILFSFITMLHAESNWVMVKCSTPLSYYVDFDCMQDDILTAKVVRSGLFTPRYYYDLYSSEGTFLARGINRVFSLGLIFPNQMEFDIYDDRGEYVGYIDGKFWTSGTAKFGFSNSHGMETGYALLSTDSDQAVFSVVSSTNKIVATLNGTLSGDLSKWELDVKKPLDIDQRALKIFTAFISDFHSSFIRKPETHYHYYNYSDK